MRVTPKDYVPLHLDTIIDRIRTRKKPVAQRGQRGVQISLFNTGVPDFPNVRIGPRRGRRVVNILIDVTVLTEEGIITFESRLALTRRNWPGCGERRSADNPTLTRENLPSRRVRGVLLEQVLKEAQVQRAGE